MNQQTERIKCLLAEIKGHNETVIGIRAELQLYQVKGEKAEKAL